jgi:phosphoglycolate phosphatase-like HAD superfamily hydrolase
MIKYILLDLDGTLLNISERYYQLYKDISKKLNINPLPKNKFWQFKRLKKSNKDIVKKTYKGKDIDLICSAFERIYLRDIEKRKYLKFDTFSKENIKTIQHIKQKNIKIVIWTLRKSKINVISQLKKFGVNNMIDGIISREDIRNNTKDIRIKGIDIKKEMIAKFIEMYKNKGTLVIGDTEADILAGKFANLPTIAVCNGLRDKSFLLNEKPFLLLNSLSQLNLNKLNLDKIRGS